MSFGGLRRSTARMAERWATAGEAERMALTLHGNREASIALLATPSGRDSLGRRNAARAPDFIRNFDAALAALLDSVRDAAAHVALQKGLRPVDRVAIVGVPDDPVATASLGRFSDGTAIIRVSDSLIGHLASLGAVVEDIRQAERSTDRGTVQRTAEAAVASLRFSLLAQRCADIRVTVPRRGRQRVRRSPKLDAVSLSPLFVLAHELGHEAHGHSTSGSRPEAEYEADLFGLMTLMHMQTHLPKLLRVSESTVAYAVSLAIAGIEIEERGLWIHLPATHPSAAMRREHLSASFPALSDTPVKRCDRIFLDAASLEHMLPLEWWDALGAHSSWQIDRATILPIVKGLDQIPVGDLDSDIATLRRIITSDEFHGRHDLEPLLNDRSLSAVYALVKAGPLRSDLATGLPLLHADACDEVARGLHADVALRDADWATRAAAAVLVRTMLR